MNLAFAIISLIIVLLINFILMSNKSIPRKSSVLFKKEILLFEGIEVLEIVCCILGRYLLLKQGFDGITEASGILNSLYRILVHCHLFLIIELSFLSLEYAIATIGIKTSNWCNTVSFAGLFIFLLPVEYRNGDGYLTYSGGATIAAFCICLTVLLLMGILVFRNRKKLSQKMIKSFLVWFFFWIVSAVVSVFIEEYFFVSITCAFGFLVNFMFVENPEMMQGAHKDTMLFYYMSDCFDYFVKNEPYLNIIGIRITDQSQVADFLKKFKNYKEKFFLFEEDGTNFYSVFSDKNKYTPILKEYIKQNNLRAIHFDNFCVVDTSRLSLFFKENIMGVHKGEIRFVSKEDFFKMEEELRMKREIEQAILDKRIVAYVQPIYNVKKERFTCGECLCRMEMKNGDILTPPKFIGIAEKYGLICDIETEMFKNMCNILIKKEELGLEYLEANLSIKKGESANLFDEYVDIMNAYGIDGNHINLEITETDVVAEKNALIKNMMSLQQTGINFSLDDFGTGESNLGYVIDMPVDIMKFDRDIFQKAVQFKKAKVVVENTIKMAHKLGLKVVVEGVEIESDFKLCKEMGVDYVQGYYFSKPLSVHDFESFCKERNFA